MNKRFFIKDFYLETNINRIDKQSENNYFVLDSIFFRGKRQTNKQKIIDS